MLKEFKQEIKKFVLVPASGGQFEVSVNDELIYSKKETGEFPDETTIVETIHELNG